MATFESNQYDEFGVQSESDSNGNENVRKITPTVRGQVRGNPRSTSQEQNNANVGKTGSAGGGGDSSRNVEAQTENNETSINFKMLEELEDAEGVILEIINSHEQFNNFLTKSKPTFNQMLVLVKSLGEVCSSPFTNAVYSALKIVLNDPFRDNLKLFIDTLPTTSFKGKKEMAEIFEYLIKICETILNMELNFDIQKVQMMLNSLKIQIPAFKQQISTNAEERVDKLINQLLKGSGKGRTKKIKKGYHPNPKEPPNNFRYINIYPSTDEVLDNKSFLRPNVVQGPYKDVDHYLDVQFRLVREDFIRPLRNTIQACRLNSETSMENVYIYRKVKFLRIEPVNEHYCMRVLFSTKNKNASIFGNSKRLMNGLLVCFTCNDFKTVIFGKICERKLEDLQKGQLIVEFEDITPITFDTSYIMIECKLYFESTFQVLKALKSMTSNNFPMEKYIIRVDLTIQSPQYLTDPNCKYKIGKYQFSPLQPWPARNFYNLHQSQLQAFKAALTQEFAIIQGPPGTGKTHLGLLLVRTLLDNEHLWHRRSPILVLCYTNHALDQFLKGVLKYTKQILRVGGVSSSEVLKTFNLKSLSRIRNRSLWEKIDQLDETKAKIKEISDILAVVDSYQSVITFEKFDEMLRQTWFYHARSGAILDWLLAGRESIQVEEKKHKNKGMRLGENSEGGGEVFTVPDGLTIVSLKSLREEIQILKKSLSKGQNSADISSKLSDLENKYDYLHMRLSEGTLMNKEQPSEKPKNANLINPKLMNPDERWSLYFYWLRAYKEKLTQTRDDLNCEFQKLFKKYEEIHSLEITKMLKEALVVGMTTTQAARFRLSLQSVKCPIVIVEEAAEVLESHIVVSVTEHCQHLIMIGDHQQLRPKSADFQIETKFKLGISLFERMILNSDQYCLLKTQHRMRSDISSLISPIYPFLEDHPCVRNRPQIKGVDACVYFIDHDNLENKCEGTSKANQHEISFFICFAKYLLLNGYSSENITILTAYLAQVDGFAKEISKHKELKAVRVSVLDNYQGKECDIILLSLVRNNKDNKIGFLSTENRICVALSRAKNGFYIMGNMKQLCRDSDLWFKVRAILQEQDAIGPKLRLRCQIHPDVITYVTSEADFMAIPDGGCKGKCDRLLICGHKCNLICHTTNQDHEDYQCEEDCSKLLCDQNDTHECKKKCFKKCGPCNYVVTRELPCGHETQMECHLKTKTYQCAATITVELVCGHITEKLCSKPNHGIKCTQLCNELLVCGHLCGLTCHFEQDPEHLQYKCKKRCTKYLKDCTTNDEKHKCRKLCYEECDRCTILVKKQRSTCQHVHEVPCYVNADDLKCNEPCTNILKCDHQCRKRCHEECGQCDVKVSKSYPMCGHSVKMGCLEEPDRKNCNKKCPLKLACGHFCVAKCNEPCTTNCNVLTDCSILGECGHTVTKIKCSMLQNPDLIREDAKLPLKFCNRPCETPLKCGHVCSGTCSECHQGRFHKRCEKKCSNTLICNHRYELPCKQTFEACTSKCLRKCQHNSCSKKCFEICTACKKKCPRSCVHQKCSNICGEFCDVPPCKQPCQKVQRCGHTCSGFCGDPCPPKCLYCEKEFVDENERYVFLNDCKHAVENSVMEEWLEKYKNQPSCIVCPKCETAIMTTHRYSDLLMQTVEDISLIKQQLYGTLKENEEKRQELHRKLFVLKQNSEGFSSLPKIKTVLESLESQLKSWTKNKQRPIHKYQLETLRSKLEIIEKILNSCDTNPEKYTSSQVNFILNLLKYDQDYFTKQEVEDISCEITRFLRMVELNRISKIHLQNPSKTENVEGLRTQITKYTTDFKKFSEKRNEEVQKLLKELQMLVLSELKIFEYEDFRIFRMTGFHRGDWFKCSNGHVHAADSECSFYAVKSKCLRDF